MCGTNHKGIQRRLLLEPGLTFDKAIELVLAAEAADKDSRRLTGANLDRSVFTTDQAPPGDLTPVHTLEQDKPQQSGSRQKGKQQGTSKLECHRCGGKHHPSSCPCKEFSCPFCKKKGHMAKMCRKKNKNKVEQANTVIEEEEAQSGDDQQEEYEMFHVCSGQSKPYRVTVKTNGHPLSMEIDTGASVSVVGEDIFRDHSEGRVNGRTPEDISSIADIHGRSHHSPGVSLCTS